MTRTLQALVGLVLPVSLLVVVAVAALSAGQRESDGWQIPQGAAAEANPVALDAATREKGRQIFRSKCQRCHGPGGRGDGSESDPDRPPPDLTDASRAARNPDGVMFYKVWNGRRKPKMPAFSAELSRDDTWTVVHFVKGLRKP
jgi:mono/diheme cytochrome c family protein